MDINLSSQIVVQTAVQWAADNTVYSNKRILVTSDVFYGSTDQRKFKIADGVQTWAQLDYMPIAQTLAEVLANGSLTNEQYITSNNQYANLWLLNTSSHLRWDSNTTYGQVVIDNTKIEAEHDARIDLNAPTINLPQSTASRIMATDGSKNIQYLNTATYPSLTELSYVKGLTSSVQTQLNAKLTSANITQTITDGVTDKAPSEDAVYDALALKLSKSSSVQFGHTALNPVDNASYFFAPSGLSAQGASSIASRRLPSTMTGFITRVSVQIGVAGTLGTTEQSTLKINNVTAGTSVTIFTTMQYNAIGVIYSLTLPSMFAVTIGDSLEVEVDCPAWATNPTSVTHYVIADIDAF